MTSEPNCPHIVTADGAAYCVLAESSVRLLRESLATVGEKNDALQEEISALTKERDELRAWKESMLTVERGWDSQRVAKLLGIQLGQDIRPNLEPNIRELLKERDALLADKAAATWREAIDHARKIHP